MGIRYSSIDQRANSMNPNNLTYWTSVENRTNLLNPNNPEYKSEEMEEE